MSFICRKTRINRNVPTFFIQRKVFARINLTPAIANTLLSDTELASQVERFSFLELTINESYPELNKGKDNPTLAALAARFPLVLTNYGAGGISTRAILTACSNASFWIKTLFNKGLHIFRLNRLCGLFWRNYLPVVSQ